MTGSVIGDIIVWIVMVVVLTFGFMHAIDTVAKFMLNYMMRKQNLTTIKETHGTKELKKRFRTKAKRGKSKTGSMGKTNH